jgi:hypothetical protein
LDDALRASLIADERRIRSVVLGFRHSVVERKRKLGYLLFAQALIAD